MQKKYLIIIGYKDLRFEPRGIERVIKNQIEALNNYSILLVHYGKPEIYSYNNIQCVAIGKSILKISLLKILYIYYWKFKYSANVCSHNALLGILFLPKYCYVHDLLKNNNRYSKAMFIILKFVEYLTLALSSNIATISKCRMNEIKKLPLFSKKKIFLIYNTSNLIKKYCNNKYVYYENKKVIKLLSVRSLEPRSNLYWLIDLIVDLNKYSRNKYLLTIVGSGSDYIYLKHYIECHNLENLVFLRGYIDDCILVSMYDACDAVMVTALFDEGFGLPVIESYSANRPAFVSNVDALPEIVIDKKFILSPSISKSRMILHKFFEESTPSYDYIGYFNKLFSFDIFKSKTNEFFHH